MWDGWDGVGTDPGPSAAAPLEYLRAMQMQTIQVPARNLTEEVQNWQLRFGVGLFAFALGGAVLVREVGVTSALRYALFIPIFLACHGIYSGLTGVCGVTAAQGCRRSEEGSEPVADRRELRAVRRRGGMIFTMTALTALLVTLTLLH